MQRSKIFNASECEFRTAQGQREKMRNDKHNIHGSTKNIVLHHEVNWTYFSYCSGENRLKEGMVCVSAIINDSLA